MLDTMFLKDSPIFADVTEIQFETIDFIVDEIAIPARHFLFKEGAPARSLFIIRDGEIEIIKGEDPEKGQIVATLGEGDIFGEMAVIRDIPRTSSARARGHCSLWTIQREKLDVLRKQEPVLWGTLMHNVAGILCDRLAGLTKKLSGDSGAASQAATKGFLSRLLGS